MRKPRRAPAPSKNCVPRRREAIHLDGQTLAISKLTDDTFLALPYGIGIKQGNVALKRWVDSRLELMRKKDTFMTLLRNNVPARFVAGFSRNILRPNNTFGYAPPDSPSADTVC